VGGSGQKRQDKALYTRGIWVSFLRRSRVQVSEPQRRNREAALNQIVVPGDTGSRIFLPVSGGEDRTDTAWTK